jgi:hypothetical protein
MLTSEKIAKIASLAQADAEQKRNDAGYSGSWGDNGASDLLDTIRIWRDGIAQRIPKELKKYAKEAERADDSDYKLFLQLRARYETGENE